MVGIEGNPPSADAELAGAKGPVLVLSSGNGGSEFWGATEAVPPCGRGGMLEPVDEEAPSLGKGGISDGLDPPCTPVVVVSAFILPFEANRIIFLWKCPILG